MPSTHEEGEAHFPYLISKTHNQPNRHTLFGIAVEEFHIKVDESNKIAALFIIVEN